MPKSFDKTKLEVVSGYENYEESSNVSYDVRGNTIKGTVMNFVYIPRGNKIEQIVANTNTLSVGQNVTVRLTLPDGYFVGASNNFDYSILLKIAISIIFVIIAYCLWSKYGRDEIVVETVEYYPPNDLNSADVSFIYNGHATLKDVISLLLYLANKGYLRIEEYEEKILNVFKSKKFKIIKVKEYDGDNEDERDFFNGLFYDTKSFNICKDEVTRSDLDCKFYLTLDQIRGNLNRKENKKKIFEKNSLNKSGIILIMIGVIFMFMSGFSILKLENGKAIVEGTLLCLMIPMLLLYNKPTVGTIILGSFVFIVVGVLCQIILEAELTMILLIEIIIYSVCISFLIMFFAIIKKRTEYGREMLGRIQGFKNFLEIAEKAELEQLVAKDPEYFYNILPYAYALDVSNKWIRKFEDIAIEAPTWYYGYSDFSICSFNSFMNSTFISISDAMVSRPSRSGRYGRHGRYGSLPSKLVDRIYF